MKMISNNTPILRFPGFTGEWIETKMGEVCDVTDYVASGSFASIRENVKYLSHKDYAILVRVADFSNNFDKSKFVYVDKHAYDYLAKSNLKKGDIVMSNVGSCGLTFRCPDLGQPMTLAPNAIVIRTKYDDFYYQLFVSQIGQDAINGLVAQGAMPKFNKTEFKGIVVLVPFNISEQQKIATCLSESDNLINAQFEKVNALKEKKKGLMQQLFPQAGEITPRLRFPGFKEEWEEKKMSDVFTRLTVKNAEDNKNVLTISAQYGLISQLDFFKKSVSASDVTGYYFLNKGDFAYNKSSSQGKPVGAIKPLKLYDKGVVSTLYICFRCKDPNAIEFWEQYFDAGVFDKEIMTIAQEGARNHGLLNVPTNDFFGLSLKMPKPAEQQKIAKCLSALDDLIASESAKLDSLKDHKKGLMQQLFPQPSK